MYVATGSFMEKLAGANSTHSRRHRGHMYETSFVEYRVLR